MNRLRRSFVRGMLCLCAAGPTLLATTCALPGGTSGGVLGVCAPGFPDCVDVVVEGDGNDPSGSTCPIDNPDCGDGTTAEGP